MEMPMEPPTLRMRLKTTCSICTRSRNPVDASGSQRISTAGAGSIHKGSSSARLTASSKSAGADPWGLAPSRHPDSPVFEHATVLPKHQRSVIFCWFVAQFATKWRKPTVGSVSPYTIIPFSSSYRRWIAVSPGSAGDCEDSRMVFRSRVLGDGHILRLLLQCSGSIQPRGVDAHLSDSAGPSQDGLRLSLRIEQSQADRFHR